MDDFDWLAYGFVVASTRRKAILIALRSRPATPKELSVKVRIPLSHVSMTLKELGERNMVVCLTPNLRKGRVFDLSSNGRSVADRVEVG
jgi:predicted transcriptional regulator